jgi:hypothetical protein
LISFDFTRIRSGCGSLLNWIRIEATFFGSAFYG